jgi:hypothetical protein
LSPISGTDARDVLDIWLCSCRAHNKNISAQIFNIIGFTTITTPYT